MRKSTASVQKFEVSKTGKVCESLNGAILAAQRYAEAVLKDVGTVYVFPVGGKQAVARIEREANGHVVTYANGRS